jgi:hypothetical protein
MKLNAKCAAVIVMGFSTFAAAKTPNTDLLTGLPLLQATSSALGNEPTKMPDTANLQEQRAGRVLFGV